MRSGRAFLLALLCAFVLTLVSAEQGYTQKNPKAKPIVLKVVSFFPSENLQDLWGWRFFKKMVNERAKGELILHYAGGPEVIPTFEQPEALRKGILDAIISSGPYTAPLVPEGLSLALTKNTPTEQRKSGYYDLMVEAFKKMNAFNLGRIHFFRYSIYTAKRIDKLADLAGRKFRVVPNYEPFYRKLGIVGVSMPLGEAYTALERGLVEGVTIPPTSVRDFSWYEVLKYRMGPEFWFVEVVFLVNLDKWNKLPKHLQDLMRDCIIEAEPIIFEHNQKEMEELHADLAKRGMKKVDLSPADTERLLDVVYSATWEWVEGKAGREITAKLKAASGN